MNYRPRAVDALLDALIPYAPAIAINGPKGVGKTATAQRRASTTVHLDSPEQRNVIASDFSLRGLPDGTILFDEWQHLPTIWDSVRRSVDDGAPAGRYLMTGSATPTNMHGAHSGAGRILSLRMRPMALFERGVEVATVSFGEILRNPDCRPEGHSKLTLNDYFEQIERSGLPGIFEQPSFYRDRLLADYLLRIIDRDLPELGAEIRLPEVLRRWLIAFAASVSTPTSYSKMLRLTTAGDGFQPDKATTARYRELLTRLWLLDPVPAWSPVRGAFTRLQSAPVHQLADPALALKLLDLNAQKLGLAQGAYMAGPLFESLATLSVRVAADVHQARVFHLRTARGEREIDLIVEGDSGLVGIEIKLNPNVTDETVKHLIWLRQSRPDEVVNLIVLTTGSQAYRRPDGVLVVPLALLGV